MKESVRHYSKIILNIVMAVLVLLAVVYILPRAVYFFLPFIMGFVISKVAGPIVTWLNKKIKVKRKALSATVMLLVVGLVIFACYGISVILYRQIVGFIGQLPQMWDDMRQDMSGVGVWFESVSGKLPKDIQASLEQSGDAVTNTIGDWITKISSPTISAVGNLAMTIPNILINVIMMIISAYFFLAEKDYMANIAHKIIPRSLQEKWDILKRSFLQAVGGYFEAQLRIEVFMYLLLVIGLTILENRYALLVALGIAFLDLLPVFGTGTVLVPWALVKIVAGDYKKAVILVIIWLGGQLLRQLIQPKIVSNSIGLHPIPTLVLLFMGWKIKGVVGMILAVPIGLVVFNLHEAGAFDRMYETMTILVNDLNAFCRYSEADRQYFKKYGTTERAEIEIDLEHGQPKAEHSGETEKPAK